MAETRALARQMVDIRQALLGPDSVKFRLYEADPEFRVLVDQVSSVLPLFMEFLVQRGESNVSAYNAAVRERMMHADPSLLKDGVLPGFPKVRA